jgi:hypothetical protein
MTKRRLLNKKAYDEVMLLKKLLKGDNDDDIYVVSIQVDEHGDEGFIVEHFCLGNHKAIIVGENYTIISKMLIEYLAK